MPVLQVCGRPVEYLVWGSGAETIVLLHSSGSSGSQWRAFGAQLSARYRVIAPDLCGYGGTAAWSGRRSFDLGAEAELVLALLARERGPVHLVGHSYGGAVALHIARGHGERLRSLALIEPVAFHLLNGTDAAALAEITGVAQRVARAAARGEHLEGFGRFVDYWNGAGAWAAMPADKRSAMAERLPKVALDFHATLNESARLDDFRGMRLPTLLLHGTESPRPTRRICELLADTLPDAKREAIPGAGHMAPLTHRDAVNARIAAHIESNAGPTLRGAAARVQGRVPIAS